MSAAYLPVVQAYLEDHEPTTQTQPTTIVVLVRVCADEDEGQSVSHELVPLPGFH